MAEVLLEIWPSLAIQRLQPHGMYLCSSIGMLDGPVGTIIDS